MIVSLQIFGQSGIKNQGGVIKVDNGASIKITGSNADFTNYEDGLVDLDGVIELDGDWFNDSGGDPVFININGIGQVKFSGSSAQNIGGTNYTHFENLYLNNSAGISLGYFAQVDSILSLTNTILELDQYDMQMGAYDNLDGSFGVSNMIVSSNGGYFKFIPKLISYNIIPLGDVTGTNEYSQLYIYPYAGTTLGANALMSVRADNSKHANNSSSTDYINRFFQVSTSNITNLDINIYGFYTAADIVGTEGNISAGQYVNSFWTPGDYVNTSSNYLQFNHLSEFGDFTAGEQDVFEVAIAISNESTINEGAEDGDSILVTLSNGSFVANPNVANWQVNNLPTGVSLGSVSYITSTTVRIYLSGNRTTDYDSHINDVEVMVNSTDVNNLNSGWISDNAGVTITANSDVESLSMLDDGDITEGSESGEVITLTLLGGTFAETLNTGSWVLDSLPPGVNYNIVRENSTTVSINLTSNTNIDYDIDIEGFKVVVPESDIDDHTGSDLSVDTGVIFKATVESFVIAMSMDAAPINEGSEGTEVITITISGDTFVGLLNDANWSVNNLPEGVSWTGVVNRIDNNNVKITLAGNRTIDYDANILNMSVVVGANEITTYTQDAIVSAGVIFTATDDVESIAISASTINEGSEDNSSITVDLTNGTFYSSLDKTKWSISNLPEGVSIGSVTYVNSTQATIILSGNSSIDYDSNIDFNLSIDKSQLADVDASLSITGQLDLVAVNDVESIAISATINEGEEDGSIIEVVLANGYFNSTIDENNFTITNLPTGVEVDSISYVNSTKVNVTLIGNASDYDSDITNTTVVVSSLAFSESDGDLTDNNGVTFTASDEQAQISLSAETIVESSEDGAIINVALIQDIFAITIDNANCIVHNLPSNVTVGNYNRASDTELNLTLSGNRDIDFDVNIDSIYVEITASGLQQHGYIIKSDSVTISATNDIENLTVLSQVIDEGSEDGVEFTVVLSGGTYATSLTSSNWSISNGPVGVSVGSVSRVSYDTAVVTILGNSTADFDNDINLGLTINSSEVDDYNDENFVISGGVTFNAVVEPISMSIANNGGVTINEGSEDGAEILVTLVNDEFISTLVTNDWTVSNLPVGVYVSTFTRQSNTEVIITLAGNSTSDYDQNIDTVEVSIVGSQFVNQNVDLFENSGVLLTANPDSEEISFEVISITEREEDLAEIVVNLTGGTYSDILNKASWIVSGQPSGVTLGSIVRNTSTMVTLVLSGNSDTDFDVDNTSFSVSVLPNQVDDHADADGNLVASGNVTFAAVSEQLQYNIPLVSLTEDNVNESIIELTLVGDQFVDFALEPSNFTLHEVPAGLSIGTIEYVDNSHANVSLSFDRTDFDIDYNNVYITLKGAEIQSGADLITNEFAVSAVIEFPFIELSDNGIIEGSESLSYITVKLYEDEFIPVLDINNWNVTNLPEGIVVDLLSRIDSVTVNILLSGNRLQDYDEDITDAEVTIVSAELAEGLSDVTATGGVIFIAIDDNETITLESLVIQEGMENGASLTLNLDGGTFVNPIDPQTWQFSNLPQGVQATNISKVDSATVTFQLSGTRTQDYDNDIVDFRVTIPSSDINDIQSGLLETDMPVSFVANNEQLVTLTTQIGEAEIDGVDVILSLIDETFVDGTLSTSSFSVISSLSGLTIGGVSYINDTAATVQINFDSYDFDFNSSLTIQIQSAELTGTDSLITSSITITAVNDEETLSISTDGDGIFEAQEANEIITITLTGGTFNSILSTEQWNVSGLPEGVGYSISYVSQQQAQIELLSNTTVDYDSDMINFSVSVPSRDISDYDESSIVPSGSITFTAYNESLSIAATLNESNLNGNTITVKLTEDIFIDDVLNKDNFIIHNETQGLSINTINYVSSTEVSMVLAFDNTDFDVDVDDFYITVLSSEIRGNSDLDSDTLIITAIVELENIIISHSGLTEENINGAVISLSTDHVTFVDNTLSITNFILNDAPLGCSISGVTYINDTAANIALNFNNSDFDTDKNISISVLSAELSVTSNITSNIITVSATQDAEVISVISDGEVLESYEDGESITIVIEGGNFVNSPNFNSWTFPELPVGVTASSFTLVNDTSVTLTLSGNRTQDFDNNKYINVVIPFGDVNDVSDNITSSNGFTIIATNEPEVITMADDGEIKEGAEDGEEIVVSLSGGTFDSSLKASGISITNLPIGVYVGNIVHNTATQITLTLSGNRTLDYDGNIEAILRISGDLISDYSEQYYTVSSGVTFIGNYELDDRLLNVELDGINEDNLDGFVISAQILYDTLVDNTVSSSSIILNNSPTGVSLQSVTYINDNELQLILSFDGTDFDVDVTNFNIEIIGSELVSGVNLVSADKTITAVDESPTLSISHLGLNELNINSAEIDVSLAYDTFVDNSVLLSSITLNNAPVGLTVGSFTWLTNTTGTVVLSFDGTDFDTDVSDFSISIDAVELNSNGQLVSNNLLIVAADENGSVMASVNSQLVETTLNSSEINLQLSGETFLNTELVTSSFVLSNIPKGVTVKSVLYVSSTNAVITLDYSGADFDVDYDLSIEIDALEFTGANNLISNSINIQAVNDEETITILTETNIVEGSEDGSTITVNISGGTFAETLNKNLCVLTNLPDGVSIDTIERVSATEATVILLGNSLVDYDTDIDVLLLFEGSQIDDYTDSEITSLEPIVFYSVIEQRSVAIENDGLFENNLVNQVIEVTLSEMQFVTTNIKVEDLELVNTPKGLSISDIIYGTETTAQLVLSFDNTDFDSNTLMSVIISDRVLSVAESVESNTLLITADKDAEVFVMQDDGEILERQEDGEVVTLSLTGGTFVTGNIVSDWSFYNLPEGVSIGQTTELSDTVIEFNFTGNSQVDYDVNAIFELGVPPTAFNDYSGDTLWIKEGVTFIAQQENSEMEAIHAGLNETNINGAIINIKLLSGVFNTVDVSNSDVILNNGPVGISVSNFNKITDTTATIELSYIGVDFDIDYNLFSLTISELILNPNSAVTSNYLPIKAIVEPVALVEYDGEIFEGYEDGELVYVSLIEGKFIEQVSIDSITFSDYPNGIVFGDLIRLSDTLVSIKMIGNRTADYDVDISNITCTIESGVFSGYIGDNLIIETAIIFAAFDESLSISSSRLDESTLNGVEILLDLSYDVFNDTTLSISNFTLFNEPSGVVIKDVDYINDTIASLILEYDNVVAIPADIPDFHIGLSQLELHGVEDLISNELIIYKGLGIADINDWGISIYSKSSDVFITFDEMPNDWGVGDIVIFDANGKMVHSSVLEKVIVNKVSLNTQTGYYFVKVIIDGTEFVNKVFILPE